MDFSDRRGGKTAMSEAIQVQMLGEFTIRYGDCVISDSNDRSHRVWSLLAYLLVNRRREFTQEELINLCWSGGTGSSDPANALKSVFHRIRALLDRLEDGLGHQLLLRRSGRYVWNEEVPITLDIEQFEERCRRGDREKEPEARLRAYQAAVGCYRGDLLPRLSGEIWVMPLETYYHGLYAGAVSSAIEILEDCGRTEELAALCRQAVKIEPYKEEFYEHLMGALIENGDNREAMAVYDDMSEMLFSDFGVMPGESLRELYRQASRTVNDHTLSMDELRMQLQEENSAGGAMLCEYDFFKILYRMQARAVARMGIAVHICLLSVTAKDGSALARRSLDGVMEKLPPLLRGNLRRGDVISRCSVSQFVIMLPQANYENSCMVAERLTGAFYRRYPHSSARLRACAAWCSRSFQTNKKKALRSSGRCGELFFTDSDF